MLLADAANTVNESLETNNTRASAAVKVGADLQVTVITAPAIAAAGGSINVADTTGNQGAAPAAASSTGFYLSTNGAVDAADVFLGSRSIGELPAGATSSATTVLQIPANIAAGSYFVIGVADWNGAVAETLETNNSRSYAMPIGGDLVVSTLTVSGGGAANGPMTVTDTTKNQGADCPAVRDGILFLDQFDLRRCGCLDREPCRACARYWATSTAPTQLTVPAGTLPGTYWVIAIADWRTAITESAESNNTRTYSFRVGPDLIVNTVTAPTSAVAGTTISVTDMTWNQGGDTAPASGTAYYLSSNGTLDPGDVLLGTRTVPLLGPGINQSGSVSLVIPASTAAGTYIIFAKADGNDSIAESIRNQQYAHQEHLYNSWVAVGDQRTAKRSSCSRAPSWLLTSTLQSPALSLFIRLRLYVR